jgi:hypothetical protein
MEFEDPMVSLDDELNATRSTSPYNPTVAAEESSFLSFISFFFNLKFFISLIFHDVSFPLIPLPLAAPIEVPPLPKLENSRFINRGEEHKPKVRVKGVTCN